MRRPLLLATALIFAVVTVVLGAAMAAAHGVAGGDSVGSRAIVLVAPVTGTVDLGLAPFVDRVIDEAERDGASAVVLDIDTFGGRLDAAVTIRDRLLAAPLRTVAFVHPRAISAGALIALSAESIAVSDGATIGAATPVTLQPGAAATAADEKTVSYVRREFRATAETRGRPVEVAEAMVDKDVDIPELAPPGKLLTVTGEQALELGLADVRADDLPGLLDKLGLGGAEVRARSPNWAERAASAVTAPLVSSLLMTLGMVGLLVELRTPGFGVPGLVGLLCLALFFGGHWIVRLAGFEELLLIGIGITLLAVEVFVTPGFGVAGVLGIGALIAGLGLSLVGAGATTGAVAASLGRVAISFIIAVAAFVALLWVLPKMPVAHGIVLRAGGPDAAVVVATAPSSWIGTTGQALTPLRPAGTASLAGARVDVVTEGEFVAPGATVEVLRQEGSHIVVRPVDDLHPKEGPRRVDSS